MVGRILLAVALTAVMILGIGQAAWAQPSAAAAQGPTAEATVAREAAPEPTVTWGVGATFTSAFVWRGFTLADAPSAQPSAWISVGDFTATSWVNLGASGPLKGWSEHDLVIDYTRGVGVCELSAGYTNYYFAKAESGSRFTHEFYAGAAFSVPLNPFVTVYHDVTIGRGTYVSAGISQTIPLGASKWSVMPAATLGYNHHQWVSGAGWSDLNLGITLTRSAGSHVDAAAAFNYSKSLRTEWFPSRAYFGLTVTVH